MFSSNNHSPSFFTTLSLAIGKGVLAGLAGTAAITISQMIEMKITGREMSNAPVKVAGEVFGVKPKGNESPDDPDLNITGNQIQTQKYEQAKEENTNIMTQAVHWSYGTSWGLFRGALGLAGLKGMPATFVHFGAIWGAAMVILPAMDASEPVTKWPAKTIVIDGFHHAVYAVAAGAVYDQIK